MRNKFFYSTLIFAGMAISSSMAIAAQPRVDPQSDGNRPIIFGVPRPTPTATPTPVPHPTPTATPTAPHSPIIHRDHDRRHDRDWRRERYRDRYRDHRYRRDHDPKGWSKGRKTGWHGRDLPPGQAKKMGYTPHRHWGGHGDRDDHRRYERQAHREHGRGHRG